MTAHCRWGCAAAVSAALAVVVVSAAGSAGGRWYEEERSLYVTVEDHGAFVTGLTAADFEVEQDGFRVAAQLERVEPTANIAVLAENSARLHQVYNRYIPQALRRLAEIAPPGHWYMLASFGRALSVDVEPTHDAALLGRAFERRRVPMMTEPALWDATYRMLDMLDQAPGRRALIVLTSGIDLSREHGWPDVLTRLEQTDVVLYVVGVGVGDGPWYDESSVAGRAAPGAVRGDTAEVTLRMLAAANGGRARFPLGQFAMPAAVNDVMDHFAHQYRLVYAPDLPLDGKFHDVTVRAFKTMPDGTRRRLTVTSKDGWRTPKDGRTNVTHE